MDNSENLLKVTITTYFELGEIDIKRFEFKEVEGVKVLILDGKEIIPDMQYYFEDSGKEVEYLICHMKITDEEIFTAKEELKNVDANYKMITEIIEKKSK